ncbi:MAG TPA: GrpB family protein [Solimonas sp.]
MIQIVAYDRSWPAAYATARTELLRALGARIIAIEHTGSTSVPGLAAKPVIDICAATQDLSAFAAAESCLRQIGYEPEDYSAAQRLFYVRRNADGERTHHLHVFPFEHWPTLKERIFAAHLRQYADAAARYAALKLQLAELGLDRETYTRGKTALIQELMDAARAERGLPPEPVWVE